MSFTGIWEQYNPHILHWLIVRELVQLEIIRFRAVYLTALFFLLNQMLSLRIMTWLIASRHAAVCSVYNCSDLKSCDISLPDIDIRLYLIHI